jgi:hypothetical protein
MPLLPPASPVRPVPFATIGFSRDLPLLRLQARSFALHLADEPGRRIWVVNNDNDPRAFEDAFRTEVLPLYGPHAAQVELVWRGDVVPGFDRISGWRRQQLLKWGMSRVVQPGLYLTLDSKNCLVRPWRDRDLFTEDGRVRMQRRRLDRNLAPSFHYFVSSDSAGTDAEPGYVSNIWTPYALWTRHVTAMMEDIERREGRSAYEVLASSESLFEYALYWAFLVARGADALYDLHAPYFFAGFWFKDGEDAEAVLRTLAQPTIAWFGLHRRITPAAPALRDRIAAFLAERGFFASAEEASASLDALDGT